MDYLATAIVGLLVGAAVGWFGHVLATRRTKSERAIQDATELWDRCAEIATARIKYILAYHRRLASKQAAKDEHLDLKRRHRWADPEVILQGVPEWEAYHAAERSALRDTDTPLSERIKAVETTSYALLDAIGARRTKARQ